MRLVALTLAIVASAVPAAQAATPPLLRASVDPKERGRVVPRHFIGFSYEMPDVQGHVVGNSVTGLNQPLARLFGHITATGNGAPLLRLGGAGADSSWWNPSGQPAPPGILFSANPFYFQGIAAFQRRTKAPISIGLNMAAGQPRYTLEMARAAIAAIGARNIDAFEVGNEPDVYPRRPFGEGRTARSKGYDFKDYMREFPRFADPIRRLGRRVRIAAPNAATWEPESRPFARRERKRVNELAYHHYPLTDCPADPKNDVPNTFAGLLGRKAFRVAADKFNFIAKQARQVRRPVRLSETNSSDCGWQQNGISDRFATALWGADWLFLMATIGLDGVNFHVSGNMAPFFAVYDEAAGRHEVSVQPLYYGTLLFARATANRARLLAGTSFGQKVRGGRNVISWATRDRRGTIRVVVISKEARARGTVRIRIPGGARTGSLVRLTAPGLDSTRTDVRLGGQHFGDSSTTGEPEGAAVSERVRRRGRSYSFRLAGASAAMLTVRR